MNLLLGLRDRHPGFAFSRVACGALLAGAVLGALPACFVFAAEHPIAGNGLGACLWKPKNPPPELYLYFRGGKGQGPFNRVYNYQPVILGKFLLPESDSAPAVELLESSTLHETYRLSAAARKTEVLLAPGEDVTVDVTLNRISPAILVELQNAYMLRLFSGDKSKRLTRKESLCSWGIGHVQQPPDRMNEEFIAAYPYPWQVKLGEPCAPRRFAFSDGAAVKTGVLEAEQPQALAGATNGWALLWYGPDAWFAGGRSTMRTIVDSGDIELAAADAPMLLTFSHDPELELVAPEGKGAEGSIIFSFSEPAAKMTLMPLFGYYVPPAAETAPWSEAGLPPAVAELCDRWAQRLRQFPKTLKESIAYDAQADSLAMRQETELVVVRPGGAPHTPIPPALELARRNGFPAAVDEQIADAGMALYCGPCAVVEGAAAAEIRVSGLGKYLWPGERPAPGRPAGGRALEIYEAVQKRLFEEIDRMLALGHLAPVNLPYKIAYGWSSYYNSTVRHLYCFPGTTLRVLTAALPFLDGQRRDAVIEYLRRERSEFPPETTQHLPSDVGARREPWQLPERFIREETDKMRNQNFHVMNKLAPAECLYDLACYYVALGSDGSQMEEEGFELEAACGNTIDPWLARRDWATLGWFEWPAKDPKYYGHYGWNMSSEINRQMAAAIGMGRLARMVGNKEREALAVAAAARMFAHRLAAARYGKWLYERGGFLLSEKDRPFEFDMREAVMTEKSVLLDGCRNQEGPLPYFNDVEGPFTCMIPETAAFFRDYMAEETKKFADLTALFYPDAFMTLGSPRRCAEWWHNYPEDGRQAFLAAAWLLHKDGDWLYRHLDVPLVPAGDTFFIEKLIAVLEACCREK